MQDREYTQAVIGRWAEGLDTLHQRIAGRFRRIEPRRRARAYLEALLGAVERKSGWQIAEHAGEDAPYGIQRLVAGSSWDADGVRDDLMAYVAEHLGDKDGVLILDETGFLKKGRKSAGVARQYSGTAGKVENCQIGVSISYASRKGHAFLDRELYLPKEWTGDRERMREAGVPDDVSFQTKPQLGRAMLGRALGSGIPARWVTADEVYGRDRRLRVWLEQQGQPFVLAVGSNEKLWQPGFLQISAKEIAGALEDEQWQRLSAGDGEKGPRIYDWARVPLVRMPSPGWEHWLLVRRSISRPEEIAYYVVFAPAGITMEELVRVAGTRWKIEQDFEGAKGEAGLDEYEVRSWKGWYRHITLSLLAHAYLSVMCWKQMETGEGGRGQKDKLSRVKSPMH